LWVVGRSAQDIKDTACRPDEDAPLRVEDIAKWRTMQWSTAHGHCQDGCQAAEQDGEEEAG
jgi:hypothetical protein